MLKFFWNGVKSTQGDDRMPAGTLCPCYYRLGWVGGTHTEYGTGRRISTPRDPLAVDVDAKGTTGRLPTELADAPGVIFWNDTDSMTDYFSSDRAIIPSDSPLWPAAIAGYLRRESKDGLRYGRKEIPAELLRLARSLLSLAEDTPAEIVCDFALEEAEKCARSRGDKRDAIPILMWEALRPDQRRTKPSKPRARKIETMVAPKVSATIHFLAKTDRQGYTSILEYWPKQAAKVLARLQADHRETRFALYARRSRSFRNLYRIAINPPACCVDVVDGVPTLARLPESADCAS